VKTAPLAVVPALTAMAAKVMLACLGVYWVSLLTVTGSPGQGADTAIKIMLGAGGVFLTLVVHYHAQGLHDALRVLGALRVPDALWRAWLGAWLATITRYWAAVSAGTAIQLAMPASSTFWLAGPALLSLLLCFAALRAAAGAGLVRPIWRRAARPAALAVILALALKGPGAALAWFAALPAALLLAFSLAWPALAWACWRRHAGQVPAYGTVAPAPRRINRAAAFMRRYTVLQWRPQAEAGDMPQAPGPLRKAAMVMNGEILFYIVLLQMLTVHWNSPATPLRAIGLFFICMITTGKLAVRDLHWRGLLLPGGLQRKRIGTHILLSTLTFQVAAMLLITIAYLAARIGFGAAPAHALASVLQVAILPLELVFLTSAAVLVRTLRPLALAVLIGTAAAAGLGALYAGYDTLRWTIGPGYVLFLAAGTAACTWLANRRWTPEKLLRNMHPQGVFA
jgi:hypothetical protein